MSGNRSKHGQYAATEGWAQAQGCGGDQAWPWAWARIALNRGFWGYFRAFPQVLKKVAKIIPKRDPKMRSRLTNNELGEGLGRGHRADAPNVCKQEAPEPSQVSSHSSESTVLAFHPA